MNLFGERFPIDLNLIPLRGLKVIIGIDWLGANGAMIDCEHQLVRVRTPSGGELVIHGEREREPRMGQPSVRMQGLGGFYRKDVRDFWLISQIRGLRPRWMWVVCWLYRNFRMCFPKSYQECLRRDR